MAAAFQMHQLRFRAEVTVMNLETQAARHSWEAARHLVQLPAGVEWSGRETRGEADLVNQYLNDDNGILYAQVKRAVLLAGLDPYTGYLLEETAPSSVLVLAPPHPFDPPQAH